MGLKSMFLEWKKLKLHLLATRRSLLLKRCLVLELHKNDNMDSMKYFSDFGARYKRQGTSSNVQNEFKMLMAKGKIQVNTSFKGHILLQQSIKITLVVKLMFMGMVNRHVKVPLKISKLIQIEIEWNLVHSFLKTDFGLPQKFGRLPLNFIKVRLNWYELIFHLI